MFLISRQSGGGSGGGITKVAAGNLGAAYTLDLSLTTQDVVLVEGTLNANATVTLSNRRKCIVMLLVTQDATGGRTLAVSDGTSSLSVAIPSAATAAGLVTCTCPDATTIYVDVAGAGMPQATADDRYKSGMKGVICSPWLAAPAGTSTGSVNTANQLRVMRVVAPKSGTLNDFAVAVASAGGANVIGAIYDFGETTSGVHTRIFSGGSVAASAAGWRELGDPALTVIAGNHYLFAFTADNATATFGRITLGSTALGELPSGWAPAPNAIGLTHAVWAAQITQGSFTTPATISATDMTTNPSTQIYGLAAFVA